MARSIRRALYFLVGVMLGALACFANAETIAATSSGTSMILVWKYQDAGHTDPDALCHLLAAAATSPSMYSYIGVSDSTIVSGMKACKWIQNDTNKTTTERTLGRGWMCPGKPFGWGANPATQNYGGCTPVYSCPSGQGWTLSGTSCTRPDCPAGSERGYDGVCLPPVDPCPVGKASSAQYFSGMYGIGGGKVSGGGKNISIGNNGALCDGTCYGIPESVTGCTSQYDSGSAGSPQPIYCTTAITLTGARCTGGNGTAPSYCPSGQTIIGTANGLPVCGTDGVPSDNSAPKTTEDSKSTGTETKTDSNGDGTPDSTSSGSEKTTSSTTCVGSTCSTTTTTKTTNPDGSTVEKTTTSTESKDSYCTSNPNSEQCADQKVQAGDPASVDNLYTKGSRSVGQVFSDFGTKVRGAGFFQGASNFFSVSVPAGSCSDLSVSVDVGWGRTMQFDATPYFCGATAQAIYSILGIGVMMAALWVAFRIAIL